MLDELGYLNPRQAGAFIDRAPRTMADWRLDGRGPRYFRRHGRVLYAVADLIEWVEGSAPTSPQAEPQEPSPRKGFARRRAPSNAPATAVT